MSRVREIIQRYFGNAHSNESQKEFTFWLNSPHKKEEKEEALKNIWDNLNIQADESTHRSFDALHSQIDTTLPQIRKRLFLQKLSRIAAIILLPIISVAVTYFVMKNSVMINNDVKMVECIVPNGETKTLILPDSSIVKINSGSVLIYPEQFSNTRDIYLNGEAYFTVKKDKSKPFIVKTTDMNVEVLGTVFNVSSYSDSKSSSTTLERGKVNIQFKNKNLKSVILHPDEQIVYDRNSGSVEKHTIKAENTIAWTQGNLIIQRLTIDEIIRIIERKYAMTVYLNSSMYTNEKITMKITNGESLLEFMNVLKFLVPQLSYKIEKDKLYIY